MDIIKIVQMSFQSLLIGMLLAIVFFAVIKTRIWFKKLREQKRSKSKNEKTDSKKEDKISRKDIL